MADALAGRRPLRRHQRLPDRRRALHVALARLGDRRLQPQHAVRPVHHRADRRRPAAATPRSSSRSPPASTAIIAATREGGIIPEEYAVEYVVDRVETTATVWLGLTLGCARCHDHKYDPITQKEFYRLFAYFNNVPEHGRAIKYGNSPPMITAPTARAAGAAGRRSNAGSQRAARVSQALEPALDAGAGALGATDPRRAGRSHWTPSTASTAMHPTRTTASPTATRPRRLGQASFDGKTYLDAGDVAQLRLHDRFTLSRLGLRRSVPQRQPSSRDGRRAARARATACT